MNQMSIGLLEAAQSVAIPHNREIIHVIQRGFSMWMVKMESVNR